jgi:hypothetical protein
VPHPGLLASPRHGPPGGRNGPIGSQGVGGHRFFRGDISQRFAGGIERVNALKQSVMGVALGAVSAILIVKQHGK